MKTAIIIYANGTETLQKFKSYLETNSHIPIKEFNIKDLQERVLSERLSLTFTEVDVVFDMGDVREYVEKILSVLSKVVKEKTPKINMISMLYEKPISTDHINKIIDFSIQHNIDVNLSTKIVEKELISVPYQSLEQSFSVVNLILNRDTIPEVKSVGKGDLKTFVPQDLPQVIYLNKIVDERYWYWDEKGASLWLDLRESANYAFFKETYSVLQTDITKMTNTIFESFFNKNMEKIPSIDIIALGVGSAEKEMLILKEILDYYLKKQFELERPVFYIPMDISFPLLQNSIRAIFSDSMLKGQIQKGNLMVRPILTDFLGANKNLIKTPNEYRIIAALGVLVNLSENETFDSLKNIMDEKSFLLVDAEFIGEREDKELIKPYKSTENFRFLSHPLEMLYNLAESGELFDIPPTPGHRRGFVSYKEFKGYNVENEKCFFVDVIRNNKIEDLEEKYNLPSEKIKKYMGLSDLKESKTVVTIFLPTSKNVDSLILGYSTKYSYYELKNFISEKGFEIVKEYLNNMKHPEKSTFGYFLLKL